MPEKIGSDTENGPQHMNLVNARLCASGRRVWPSLLYAYLTYFSFCGISPTPEVKRLGSTLPATAFVFYFNFCIIIFLFFLIWGNDKICFKLSIWKIVSAKWSVRVLAYWNWKVKIILPVAFQIVLCQALRFFGSSFGARLATGEGTKGQHTSLWSK